ncbi:MAG: hypothetical protein K2X82_02775 [Gemmataceae bacterium]|nr:hypothetical protein [Gemmataceae bacterium]
MSEFWVSKLVSSAILCSVTLLVVYVMVRRSDARLRAAAAAALAELDAAIQAPPNLEDEDDPDDDPLAGWDGPMVVEAGELRGLIRAAVREALAEERAAATVGPATVPPPGVAAAS